MKLEACIDHISTEMVEVYLNKLVSRIHSETEVVKVSPEGSQITTSRYRVTFPLYVDTSVQDLFEVSSVAIEVEWLKED